MVTVIVGKGLTVITTLFDLLHPVAVMVSTTVYVVVSAGLTVGLDAVDVKPAIEVIEFMLENRGQKALEFKLKRLALHIQ